MGCRMAFRGMGSHASVGAPYPPPPEGVVPDVPENQLYQPGDPNYKFEGPVKNHFPYSLFFCSLLCFCPYSRFARVNCFFFSFLFFSLFCASVSLLWGLFR